MALQESGEMYLENIYMLLQSKSDVHAIDIVERMEYSKPSVSRALGILKREGYVTVDEMSHIHLTELGLNTAEAIYRRHVILSSFLESLGVSAKTAAEDACKIEHVISNETLEAIKRRTEKGE